MFKVGDLVQRVSGEDFPEKGMFLANIYLVRDIYNGEWFGFYGIEGNWICENFQLVDNSVVDSHNKIQTYTKEELSHIDELEDRISMLEDLCMEYAKLLDKKEPTYFKPICDMTIADWLEAKKEMWVFELGSGEQLVVRSVDGFNHPIQMSNLEWYTADGQMTYNESIQKDNIVKRVK